MKSRQPFVIAAAAALVFTVSTPSSAQWVKYQTPGIPRTADGKPDLGAPAPKALDGRPDLSGIWRIDPAGYAFDLTMDLKAGEVMPWAEALFKQRSEEFAKDFPGYRCMPSPGPLNSFGLFKIIQSPTVLAVLPEDGTYRQIHTDGRQLPQDPNPTWMGYSVGAWDGDTLVVESAGFNDQSWLDFFGHPHSEALRVTERYRRRDFGHLEVQMKFEDLKAYTRPWTITLVGELNPDTELLEYVCNENERSMQHFLVTDEDRRKNRTVVTVPRESLAAYVGIYELISPVGRRITYTVSLPGDQLIAQPPGGGRYPLVPTSPTTFAVAGTPVEFFKDAKGVVTHFIVRTVEGDQKAVRQPDTATPAR
jgi:hypothetical protein